MWQRIIAGRDEKEGLKGTCLADQRYNLKTRVPKIRHRRIFPYLLYSDAKIYRKYSRNSLNKNYRMDK